MLVILVAAAWLPKAPRLALARVAKCWQGMNPTPVCALGRVLHYIFLLLGLVIGLSTIGIDFSNPALMFGALGIGIGFGLQSMVSNFFSGIIILFEKNLKVGDFVKLESGVVGKVREINMRSTHITTNDNIDNIDNIDILVPNSEFVNGRVVNWTLDEAFRRIHVPFGGAYGSDSVSVSIKPRKPFRHSLKRCMSSRNTIVPGAAAACQKDDDHAAVTVFERAISIDFALSPRCSAPSVPAAGLGCRTDRLNLFPTWSFWHRK